MTEVIHIKDMGKHNEDDLRFICRPTSVPEKYRGTKHDLHILGNPYEIGKDGTRKEVVDKYYDYAKDKMKNDPRFLQAILQCRGKVLVCFCAPAPCHGDVIVALIKEHDENYVKTICFTGHRPTKLGGYYWDSPKNKAIIGKLTDAVYSIMRVYPHIHWIFGGALGIDQMAFEIVYEHKNGFYGHDKDVLELAMPFEGQDSAWFKETDKVRLKSQRARAGIVTIVDELPEYVFSGMPPGIYHPGKLQKRNEYMVDKSGLIIAIWDGSKGGTGNCVQYAERLNKQIVYFNPNTLKYSVVKERVYE